MNKEYKKLFFLIGIFLIFVLFFVLYLSWPLITGHEIILHTRPIDPFDIFRGQYMAITYDISRLPLIPGIAKGDRIYVNLIENESSGVWEYKEISLIKPNKALFIKGYVENINGGFLSVDYGIEQYFFERNAKINERIFAISLKTDGFGNARITSLLNSSLSPVIIDYSSSKL